MPAGPGSVNLALSSAGPQTLPVTASGRVPTVSFPSGSAGTINAKASDMLGAALPPLSAAVLRESILSRGTRLHPASLPLPSGPITTIADFTFTNPNSQTPDTLTNSPSVTITAPSGVTLPACTAAGKCSYQAAIIGGGLPGWTVTGFATVSGNTVTFTPPSGSAQMFTLAAGQNFDLALYAFNSNQLAVAGSGVVTSNGNSTLAFTSSAAQTVTLSGGTPPYSVATNSPAGVVTVAAGAAAGAFTITPAAAPTGATATIVWTDADGLTGTLIVTVPAPVAAQHLYVADFGGALRGYTLPLTATSTASVNLNLPGVGVGSHALGISGDGNGDLFITAADQAFANMYIIECDAAATATSCSPGLLYTQAAPSGSFIISAGIAMTSKTAGYVASTVGIQGCYNPITLGNCTGTLSNFTIAGGTATLGATVDTLASYGGGEIPGLPLPIAPLYTALAINRANGNVVAVIPGGSSGAGQGGYILYPAGAGGGNNRAVVNSANFAVPIGVNYSADASTVYMTAVQYAASTTAGYQACSPAASASAVCAITNPLLTAAGGGPSTPVGIAADKTNVYVADFGTFTGQSPTPGTQQLLVYPIGSTSPPAIALKTGTVLPLGIAVDK